MVEPEFDFDTRCRMRIILMHMAPKKEGVDARDQHKAHVRMYLPASYQEGILELLVSASRDMDERSRRLSTLLHARLYESL